MNKADREIEIIINSAQKAKEKINSLIRGVENDLERVAIFELGRIIFEENLNNIKSEENSFQANFTIFLQKLYRELLETQDISIEDYEKEKNE